MSNSAPTPCDDQPTGLTVTQWLIVVMAAIGFAFDIYELLMLPLVLRPAILELGTMTPADKGFVDYVAFWRSLMFYVPAVAGGIFGLLGGYLTDRLGRRRVLTWSILLYSVSAFLAGYSTSLTPAGTVKVGPVTPCRCGWWSGIHPARSATWRRDKTQ